MKHLIVALGLVAGVALRGAEVKIDVLVAYDTTAQAWLSDGGKTADAFATQQIEKMNTVLANSGLASTFSFRLAGTHVGTFTYGTSIPSTLQAAIESTSADWKALRADRETNGADLVVVLADTKVVTGQSGESTALLPIVNGERIWDVTSEAAQAWIEGYFADRAYSVCDIDNVDRGYTMVHEVGHMMGAGHADIIDSSYSVPGPQLEHRSSGYMYKGSDGVYYSTIMGYAKTRNGDPNTYTILPCFSSPDVVNEYTGEPLGDASHDNVQTLLQTYKVIAGLRQSVLGDNDAGSGTGSTQAPALADGGSFDAKTEVTGVLKKDGKVAGIAKLVVAKTKNGQSKVSGYVVGMDGKKKTVKAAKCDVGLAGGVARVSIENMTVKGYDGALNAVVGMDGSILGGSLGAYALTAAKDAGVLSGKAPAFSVDGSLGQLGGFDVIDELKVDGKTYNFIPSGSAAEPVSVQGEKWVAAAKPAKLKSKNGEWVLDTGADGSKSNLSALKISFNKKMSTFKGSFTVYADTGDKKLKKFKFAFAGVVAEGSGTGEAVCKSQGVTVPVSVK